MATVVELISTMLKREGVQYRFGIPGGGGMIDLLDATPPSSMPFASCDGRDFNHCGFDSP